MVDHRFLRPEGLPLFEQELIDPGGIQSILRETGERLRHRGFEVPFEGAPTNLFVEEEGAGPKPVRWEGERFTVLGGGGVEPFDLLCRIEDLMPGPVLRPLLRAMALPAAAEIAGPVEAARYAQLRFLHPYFGLPAPLVFPRLSLSFREGDAMEATEPWIGAWVRHGPALLERLLAGADLFDFRHQQVGL